MSLWRDEDIANKLVDILKDVEYKGGVHAFGRPSLTSYQLAIEFKKRFPAVVALLPAHSELGGEGTGEYNSLSQYIARQISGHFDDLKRLGIECGFLSSNDLERLEFSQSICSSVDDVSMFRYVG